MRRKIRRDNQTVQEIFEQYQTYQELHVYAGTLRELETELEIKRVHMKIDERQLALDGTFNVTSREKWAMKTK